MTFSARSFALAASRPSASASSAADLPRGGRPLHRPGDHPPVVRRVVDGEERLRARAGDHEVLT
ncbi:MAG: hypothetical protein PGN11_09245, partial [Quadrisphaera sp.]